MLSARHSRESGNAILFKPGLEGSVATAPLMASLNRKHKVLVG